jgi:hypothetical protein
MGGGGLGGVKLRPLASLFAQLLRPLRERAARSTPPPPPLPPQTRTRLARAPYKREVHTSLYHNTSSRFSAGRRGPRRTPPPYPVPSTPDLHRAPRFPTHRRAT